MPTYKFNKGALVRRVDPAETEITLAAWREGVRPEGGRFALVVPNDCGLEEVAPTLSRFTTVILEFPAFKDGRAYSQARLLRERYAYAGEIRARGDVLCDQAMFMTRAGIDAFEIEEAAADQFAQSVCAFSHVYQHSSDGAAPIWRQRLERAAAA